jgi:membrane dipeptidase
MLGASLLARAPRAQTAGAPARAHSERWRGIIIVNALGAIDDPNTPVDPAHAATVDTMAPRLLEDAHRSGLSAINVTLGYVGGPAEPFEASVRDIAHMDALIRAKPHDLMKVYRAADIARSRAEERIGIFYGFQNSAMLGHDVGRIDLFDELGVRVIQLTYNPANAVGDGCMAPENRGLSPFGREVVARLNDRRLMVDLSHSGQRTCLEAARLSRQPVSINHTGCRALVDLPRNKTDEELRLVAERGGFVGIYFMPFLSRTGHATARDVVEHLEHAVNVCGEDHVGIGTDGTVTPIDDLEAYRIALAREIEERKSAGIGAAGEGPDTLPFVIDLRGAEQFHELADRLAERGFSSARIEKILGRNFVSYATEVWGG